MVDVRRIIGKELNSKGFSINRTVINTRPEIARDIARDISNNHLGMGIISTTMIEMRPRAKAISPLFMVLAIQLNEPV
jgi:hypothetical protein